MRVALAVGVVPKALSPLPQVRLSMALLCLALAVAHMPATRRALLQSLPAAAAVGAMGAHASRAAALSAAPLAVAAAPSAGSEFYSGLLAGAVDRHR